MLLGLCKAIAMVDVCLGVAKWLLMVFLMVAALLCEYGFCRCLL